MVRIGGANTTQTNHQLNNLDDNTLYDFIVVAISPGGGPSEESPVVSASTLPLSKSLGNGRVVFLQFYLNIKARAILPVEKG